MKRLAFALAGATLAAGAFADTKKGQYFGLEVGYDAWQQKDSGAQHTDVYLKAKDKTVLEKFLKELPADHAIPKQNAKC